MNQSPTVLKFGGTSVEDARAFERVASIVLAEADASPVVVVSAMSRVTDALLASFKRAAEEGSAEEAALALEEHFERHRAVARELLSAEDAASFEATLGRARCELAALLQAAAAEASDRPALQDEVVSYGERLSADLLAGALRGAGSRPARYVDARRCIVTDGQFGQAEPEMKETTRASLASVVPILEAGEIPVLGGFIASTPEGMTTTLGRGGSDYTAAIVGAALAAREIQIWTDVSGVLTADPRVVAGARSIPRLSYAEAAELAYFGAKVLHPKTILPAVVRGIPVRICNSRDPASESTVINFDTDATPHTVKAIAHKKNVTIVHVTSARMLGAYGFLRALFEVFDRHRTVVDLVTTSEVSVSLSLDGTHALAAIVADLERIGAVKVEHGRAVICVVGEGLRDARGVAAKIFTAVRDINVMLISQGASSINLTFVVDEPHAEQAVRQLHEAFFEQNTRELYQTAAADD
ncbi:MAG TPA: lysine-sensitive aspartokinase 3 [Pyrinomonadaceae bacterium]|nr:lysine-sensitive aspartokinase 3 [Pyrinomonadaceae bacterium]